MTKIYACLTGNWVCLNDDPDCTIGEERQSPAMWWKEGASVYTPSAASEKENNSFYHLPYVHIYYKKKDYRIHPAFMQIITE